MAPLDRAAILALIPHQGTMCLLDAVVAWDEGQISCRAADHQSPHHPLARCGQLPALAAFEYGAQAMAVHGALLEARHGRRAPLAFLAAIRDGQLWVPRLDPFPAPLTVGAQWLTGSAGNALYQCSVRAQNQLLATARIAVIARRGEGL
ncbi:MAG: hydroxymyristoyl-ACP dehydratase [Candidatus Competibacterales bacterium]